MRISQILAADENDVIGRDGALPWHIPADAKRFKEVTTSHVMVAGRKTHESIVERLGRPLPGRITVVVTRRPDLHGADNVLYLPDVPSALSVATAIEAFAGRDEVFVIGGAEIYAEALPSTDRIYLTRVHDEVDGDTAMPEGWLRGFVLRAEEPHPADGFTFLMYERG